MVKILFTFLYIPELAQRQRHEISFSSHYDNAKVGFTGIIEIFGQTFTSTGHQSKVKAKEAVSYEAVEKLLQSGYASYLENSDAHYLGHLNSLAASEYYY